jgi:hypothetical protein
MRVVYAEVIDTAEWVECPNIAVRAWHLGETVERFNTGYYPSATPSVSIPRFLGRRGARELVRSLVVVTPKES